MTAASPVLPHRHTGTPGVAPLPHLIQIREGGRSRVINQCTIRKWLSELANNMALTDTDGTALHSRPMTSAGSSLPTSSTPVFPSTWPHRLGHNNIEVTRGHTAVYQKDVFEAYDRFIDNHQTGAAVGRVP